MKKQDAINLFGGSVRDVAVAIGISVQAVYDWPDDLTDAITDRVVAGLLRTGRVVPPELLAAGVRRKEHSHA